MDHPKFQGTLFATRIRRQRAYTGISQRIGENIHYYCSSNSSCWFRIFCGRSVTTSREDHSKCRSNGCAILEQSENCQCDWFWKRLEAFQEMLQNLLQEVAKDAQRKGWIWYILVCFLRLSPTAMGEYSVSQSVLLLICVIIIIIVNDTSSTSSDSNALLLLCIMCITCIIIIIIIMYY